MNSKSNFNLMDLSQEKNADDIPIKEDTGATMFLLKNKWKFLVFLILAQLGQQYNMQAVETLQVPLQQQLNMDEKGYGYLIMAQSLPGLFVPFLCGYLIDYVGGSRGFTGSIVLTLIGHIITTFGAYEKSLGTFIFGKVIFIIAFEATYLARIKLLRIWFEDAELNRANSYIILAQTTSVIICDVAYPNIYQATQSLGFPFLIGAFVSIFSVFMCLFTNATHKKLVEIIDAGRQPEDSPNHHVSFSVYKQFPPLMWYVILTLTVGLSGTIMSKIYLSKFLQMDFGYSIGEAGYFLALSQILSAAAALFAGFFADRYGKIPYISIAGCVSLILGTLLNIIIPKCERCFLPAVPIMFLSFATAPLFIASYGALTRLIPEKNLGMATSLIPVVVSVQMAIYSAVGGAIAHKTVQTYGYRCVFGLTLCIAFAALGFAFKVHTVDLAGEKILHKIRSKQQVEEETQQFEMESCPEEDSKIKQED